jgi:hypothetical protein
MAALGPPPAAEPVDLDADFESLCWFWLSEEVQLAG